MPQYDSMAIREEIQKRIDRKRDEVVEFEVRIREATIYIQALEETLKLLPREQGDAAVGTNALELRVGSKVAKPREFLKRVGHAEHILDILRAIGEQPTHANR